MTTSLKNLLCDLLWGSSVSSEILFFTNQNFKKEEILEYDDIGILRIGRKFTESATKAWKKIDSLVDLARINTVSFESIKLLIEIITLEWGLAAKIWSMMTITYDTGA